MTTIHDLRLDPLRKLAELVSVKAKKEATILAALSAAGIDELVWNSDSREWEPIGWDLSNRMASRQLNR